MVNKTNSVPGAILAVCVLFAAGDNVRAAAGVQVQTSTFRTSSGFNYPINNHQGFMTILRRLELTKDQYNSYNKTYQEANKKLRGESADFNRKLSDLYKDNGPVMDIINFIQEDSPREVLQPRAEP